MVAGQLRELCQPKNGYKVNHRCAEDCKRNGYLSGTCVGGWGGVCSCRRGFGGYVILSIIIVVNTNIYIYFL